MQETLDTIIGEHQPEAIENGIYILSIICGITDVLNKLNKNLSVISLALTLSFPLCISLDMEINLFT